jgi:hypothetical protein
MSSEKKKGLALDSVIFLIFIFIFYFKNCFGKMNETSQFLNQLRIHPILKKCMFFRDFFVSFFVCKG